MSHKNVWFVVVPLVFLVLAQLACSNDDLLKIKSDSENNVIATTVPVVGQAQKAVEQVNKAVEQVVVPQVNKAINDAKVQVKSSVAGQALENSGQAVCVTGVLTPGCNGK